MKAITNLGIALLVIITFSFLGCSSSGTVSRSNQDSHSIGNYTTNNWTLEDFLRRANGVHLMGYGENAFIVIRGPNSIGNAESQPLFVVDGQKVGRSFYHVSSMFSRGEILSVTVLPPGAASQYGMEGNYGVIEVESVHSN